MAQEQLLMTDILSDEPPKKPEPVEAPAPDAAAPAPDEAAAAEKQAREDSYKSKRRQAREKEAIAQGKVRDPATGQFVAPPPAAPEAKGAEPSATATPEAKAADPAKAAAPQQEFTEKERAFLRAAQEERQKRQELEKRLAAIEAAAPKEPAKTFWDDPEAALKANQDAIRSEVTNARLQMAEFHARQRHTDFDEQIATFSELVKQTPGIVPQWLAAPDPAEFAYRLGKNHRELQEVGGIEQMRAKIERETAARVRAEVEAELRAKADALAKDRAALPPSLSDAKATGGASKPVWGGPPSMTSILNDD